MGLIKFISNLFRSKGTFENKVAQVVAIPEIDKNALFDNLIITQHYCEKLLKTSPELPPVSIFRSYNPISESKPLFTFKNSEAFNENLILAYWNVEPYNRVPKLFSKQLEYKKDIVKSLDKPHDYFNGKIITVDYDAVISDGASEWESEGFFDLYDLPPIDTWVYLAPNKEGRTDLYAWIPDKFNQLVQNAIDVNVLGIINWFDPNE